MLILCFIHLLNASTNEPPQNPNSDTNHNQPIHTMLSANQPEVPANPIGSQLPSSAIFDKVKATPQLVPHDNLVQVKELARNMDLLHHQFVPPL